ncbi:plasmid mobilization protein [Chitinophaga pinensis]|uniref:Mobilisation protein n=1 Tax=Chitinophaga pinensis (strain ATCC 43595 / DSM 2588 / LMG 13176 / NBRC 15968 / NCIMB 11800 / UQM 2034) TaxID=485918 RepID=A0A979GAQ1_CHIPD|nr:plasmid mobilization relaxosome protein MobC [Chitinophaga pinensis]ACU63730.1 mobilisation protein [Chitinophaga pinensis DSM 2588]
MSETQNPKPKEKRVLIQLRTTEEDKNTLREFAKHAGMNITDFVKFRTLSKRPRLKVATPEREVLLHLLSELGKNGSNINQIAKIMNADNKTSYSVSVKEDLIAAALEEIRQTTAKIVQALEQTAIHDSEGENSR